MSDLDPLPDPLDPARHGNAMPAAEVEALPSSENARRPADRDGAVASDGLEPSADATGHEAMVGTRPPWFELSRPASLPGLAFDLLLIALIAVGVIFRFGWSNWNQGTDLHPDEYGLTSTLTQLSIPKSLGD